MKVQPSPRPAARAARQRGQAMLLTVLLLGVGVAAVVYTLATPAKLALDAERRTALALAQAKEALIGRAATDQSMPGSLPCPDTDDDGSAELFVGNQCPVYIGRLPWRTLGLTDLRDGAGERLWYALSPNFRDDPSASPLNSDTAGQLTITGTAPVNNVIAIVFAPGLVVGSQDRSNATSTLCATTGTSILNSLCAGNYLEDENANGMPPGDMTFVTALASTAFNDTLLPITSDALFSVVNIRVAKEAIAALETYRNTNFYYPFASLYANTTYSCDGGTYRGRFPLPTVGCGQAAWPAGTPPAWFAANNWNRVTYYALSKVCGMFILPPPLDVHAPVIQLLCATVGNFAGPGGATVLAALKTADDPLIVTGVTSNARALVIVTGRALGAQVHPCTNASECMEDAANTDGDSTFVKPSRFPTSNDRMAVMCASDAPCAVIP